MKRRHEATVTIERIDERGLGRARATLEDGREVAVRVPNVLAGERARVSFMRRKGDAYPAELLEIVESRTARREPFCRHFAECGGCTMQDLPYPAQLEVKRAIVSAAYRAHGFTVHEQPEAGDLAGHHGVTDATGSPRAVEAVDPVEIGPIEAAPRERAYRNKLEYSCGSERWLTTDEIQQKGDIPDRRGIGFHVAGRFDRVIDLTECHLQPEPSNNVRDAIRAIAHDMELSFNDPRGEPGELRQVVVRTTIDGSSLVHLVFGAIAEERRQAVLDGLARRVSGLTTVAWSVNTTRNDDLQPHPVAIDRGAEAIVERCGHISLRIRPRAFYQTNSEQAVVLYRLVEELLEPRPDDTLLDLYCGIGSIGLFLARRVARVIGVERVGEAIQAARENAELNGIDSVEFRLGEVEQVLPRLLVRGASPRLAVIDPPRAGLHPHARAALIEAGPERLAYVSCNPRTQARDLAELRHTYRISHLRPVDMFPQTRHVEAVAIMERLESAVAAR